MRIGIDTSPLQNERLLAHRVRGTGFYIENLKKSLLKYHPQNEYAFFTNEQKLPTDLDLIHYPYFEPFFLTLPLYKKYKKVVVTVHDLIPLVFPKYFPAGIRGNLKWQLQKIALGKSDAIITDSECSKRDLARYTNISGDKVHRVYLAAGDEFEVLKKGKWESELRKKYNLPDKFVLYVGDATWNKNIPSLIAAIKKISIPLVMVGKALVEKEFDKENPWNQDLVKVRELSKGDSKIILTGFVPTKDLVAIYNLATVFAMPSIYEGFGLPVLEAMACGCPVITTKEGSLPEIAGNAAYYVDSDSVGSIASGVKKIFTSSQLQKELSQKGTVQSKKFTWSETSDKTMGIYRSIVANIANL